MSAVLIEYHQDTGEIRQVKTFACAVIPEQEVAPGHAIRRMAGELARRVADCPTAYRIHPLTLELERCEVVEEEMTVEAVPDGTTTIHAAAAGCKRWRRTGAWRNAREAMNMTSKFFVCYDRTGTIQSGPYEAKTQTDFQRFRYSLATRNLEITEQQAADIAFEGIERWYVEDPMGTPTLKRKE